MDFVPRICQGSFCCLVEREGRGSPWILPPAVPGTLHAGPGRARGWMWSLAEGLSHGSSSLSTAPMWPCSHRAGLFLLSSDSYPSDGQELSSELQRMRIRERFLFALRWVSCPAFPSGQWSSCPFHIAAGVWLKTCLCLQSFVTLICWDLLAGIAAKAQFGKWLETDGERWGFFPEFLSGSRLQSWMLKESMGGF